MKILPRKPWKNGSERQVNLDYFTMLNPLHHIFTHLATQQ